MLVLSRKLNETIVIDGSIRITVVGIRGNQIRLGIEAPDRVGILREELCLLIRDVEGCGKPSAPPEAPMQQSGFSHRQPEIRPLRGRQ
jgi:carbon storage regulator